MLDSDTPVTETPSAPRRRRSATRTAGPPTPVDQLPTLEATSAPEKPKTTRGRKKATPVETDPVPMPVTEAPAAQPTKTRRRRATQTPEVAETPAVAHTEPEAEEKPKRTTRRRAKAVADPLVEAVAKLVADKDVQTSEPAPRARRSRKQKVEAFGVVGESPDQVLESLTAVISGENPVSESAGPSNATTADDVEGDLEEPRRRRRRRGGRRRRRGDSESDEEQTETDTEEDESNGDEDAVSESGTRRRRRRRRRGEEIGEAEDDPTQVVVRVREPRRSKNKESGGEVTGIEGSTRVEAKKQRRREGRAAGRRRAPILSESEFLARREQVDRKMIIRQTENYSQIAVLEDGILVEHYVDSESAASMIGNIYLGRVQNVLPSMEAAFIDIGRGRNAVIYAGEIDWDSFGEEGQEKKVEQVFKSGQSILVQVSKDPVGAKGARLTSHISLPGRYVVYSPGGQLSGISRKLPEPERRRLKDILDQLIGPEASVIIRTAAEGATEEELVRDVNRLTAQWEVISKKAENGAAPKLLHCEPDLTVRIVRDLFTEDFKSLVVDGLGTANDAWDNVEAYVAHVAPHLRERLEHWDRAERGDLFDHYRVQEQVAKALERKVFLPSGGSLIIDRTEAMTVIDVNTGKFTGSQGNLEATVTSNNLEAAEEIVRQLRLRDIGGIIVIDFIDMVLPSNRELLLRRLVESLSRDRTRHQVAEVTSLGLVQMTRKKIGTGLAEAFTVPCETCHGRGYHTHDAPVATQAPADGGDREQRRRNNYQKPKKSEKNS